MQRVRASNAVDHTTALAASEPHWGSRVHPFGGGWLVLAGAGMYINQAMAAGLGADIVADELDLLFAASAEMGVPPVIEVSPTTSAGTRILVRDRGLVHDEDGDIDCLSRELTGAPVDAPEDVLIRPVESPADLAHWQATARTAWGHTTPEARRASDAFAAAAHRIDGEHMAIAYDAADHRTLGCASMTVSDGVAMCGGMSTLPTERRRGVQAAMLRYRLALARELGCDLAVTTAASGSASARNLRRHGFAGDATIERHTMPAG